MEEVKRVRLKKNDLIRLSRKINEKNAEDCKITSFVGEGSSCICYSAIYEGKRGRLKEFYPKDISFGSIDNFVSLKRTKSKQLIPVGDGMAERFMAMCNDFTNAYQILEQVKNEKDDNDVLNNYIPAYYVLYGVPDDGQTCASVYAWTPDDKKCIGFNEYLKEVRKYPKKNPVHKLYDIIGSVITLTDCIKALHFAGLLHLDIKPSNFAVTYNSAKKLNIANISMFDINTLHPINSKFPKISGTDGYRAPEVDIGKAENRSDIYSIGAMLFDAIIISDEIEYRPYQEEYYCRIDQLVNSSKLMDASESNSNVFLKSILSKILKKCLAKRPQDRYSCCEDLIEDLEQARATLLPGVMNASLFDAHIMLKAMDHEQSGKYNPDVIIWNLLFKDPLIDWVPVGKTKINVLVVGAGTYGQKFIDICLQVGQISGYNLHITAVSNNPDYDRYVYLQFRPAINQFVNVDGSLDGSKKEKYADLMFIGVYDKKDEIEDDFEKKRKAFSIDNPMENRIIVEDLILNAAADEPYQYVFIALGNDDLNKDIAKTFVDATKALEITCSVNFVVQTKGRKKYKGNPVYINEPISTNSIHQDLDRMAFNTHLSWKKSPDVNMRSLRRQFIKKYNYESSLTYALSIRYKLRSVGIKEDDCDKAAALFAEIIKDKKGKEFRQLVTFEHRRWVVEKLVNGWKAPLDASGNIDYEECVRITIVKEKVRDETRRLHPCIVRSTNEMPLLESAYTANNNAKWDSQETHSKLDDLDRMSVELHQCFRKYAERFNKQQPLQSGDIATIRQIITNKDGSIIMAYNRFELCLKNILNGSQSYSYRYDSYKEAFEKSLKLISDKETQKEVLLRLKNIHKAFLPMNECNKYRNYKSYDATLVEDIPFILTYKTQPFVTMAFDDGRTCNGMNDIVFGNVASASVISPAKIRYLYYFDENSNINMLLQKIKAVLNYFNNRNLLIQVYFTIALLKNVNKRQKEHLQNGFEDLKTRGQLDDYDIITCSDEDTAIDVLIHSLEGKRVDLFDGTTMLFTSSYSNKLFIERVLDEYNYFEFDWKIKKFKNCKGCEYLQYIKDNSCIRIEDMFALRCAVDDKFYLPEFAADYETLWRIYTGGYQKGGNINNFGYSVANWNRLCKTLREYAEKHDQIAEFRLDPKQSSAVKHLTYFLPGYGHKAVEYLLKKLTEYDVITEESTLYSYTSDTCRIDIFTFWDIEKTMEDMFSKSYLLVDYHFWKIEKEISINIPLVKVYYDNLEVDSLSLEEDDKYKYSYSILEKLSKAHFINCLHQDEKNERVVSFVYSSQRIKKLFTIAGEILEVYTYYEVLKTGYFDDVACGYEFKWEYGDVKNEIDCIVTKGFQSLMIECKGQKELDQNFYHKLASVASLFGIGTKKVLIANTYWHNEYLDTKNESQMTRGPQMDVITVSKPDDILDIGYTLRKIMEGRF